MNHRLVADPEVFSALAQEIRSESCIALDCEAAGFHRYSDRLCLVQLTTSSQTFLFDPLVSDPTPALKPALEDPKVQVIMHGGDYDLRLLDRDLGIRVRGIFDTQTAASLLGASAVGLAALLEEHLGVRLSKKHQRADWAQRPLPDELLAYAADDTRHLSSLRDVLAAALRELGRWSWAQEEFQILEEIRWEEDDSDPVTRVKGARTLSPRQLQALRVALEWRDGIAKRRDRAPFRIVGDAVLLDLVQETPPSVGALASLKGMSPRLAKQDGNALLDAIAEVEQLPEDSLPPYPRWNRDSFGRPTPEEEAAADRLRSLRTAKAEALGLERGVLLSNGQISGIVRAGPRSLDALKGLGGIRKWQVELLGEEILRILRL